jgi:DNA modification methylase
MAMILAADARALPLRDGCVDCCVTSPPYFGLRDYGDPAQIGLEPTPEAYVATLVAVCREVGRVLTDRGTLWLNLGDSYTGAANSGGVNRNDGGPAVRIASLDRKPGKPKDLLGIPWRVAFALQADGWYLRADIIWHKPNPMPESVTDRPTKAHEYVFLLAKSARYYYDAAAIAERSVDSESLNGRHKRNDDAFTQADPTGHARTRVGFASIPAGKTYETRNRRSVWTVNTRSNSLCHFAMFPEPLIEPCILAGCPVGGLVLDPFLGSGTVGAVAERFGRRWVGSDLNYHALARERTAQRGLMFWKEAAL